MTKKYGTLLGTVNINSVELDVYSNGSCTNISDEPSLDNEGEYMGMKYQCVELIRQFIYKSSSQNLALIWQGGDAKDWYANCEEMELEAPNLADAKIGDIITFSGGDWGHVGVIRDISDENIHIIQQNFLNDIGDLDFPIKKDILENHSEIHDANGSPYKFQSLLRMPQSWL